jgi:hypothetical protein
MQKVSSRACPIACVAECSSAAECRSCLQCCICALLWSSEQWVCRPCLLLEMHKYVYCVLISCKCICVYPTVVMTELNSAVHSTTESTVLFFWLAEFKFLVTVQRKFRQAYGQDPPEQHSIVAWHKQLLEMGSVLRRKGSSNWRADPDWVETILEKFQCSPRKSIHCASHKLHILWFNIHYVAQKRLRLRAHKIQLIQKLRANDKPSHHTFKQEMLLRLLDDNDAFLKHVVSLDEATFHISGKVNWHNCWIWRSENPHKVMEHQCGTPNLMCGVAWEHCIWTCQKVRQLTDQMEDAPSHLHIMPTKRKPFLISSFQAKELGDGVLLHGLPGHQIWPL